VKGGVNYDDNDRYCLDGQRLIAISGQDGKSGSFVFIINIINGIVASIGDFIHCPKPNNEFSLCLNLGIIRITILKGLSAFGFSCPMITRELQAVSYNKLNA
jgi:hypothetical protein